MALIRDQIEDWTDFPFVKEWLKEHPWKHINKNSRKKRYLKRCINKLIRRMSIEDTPVGKTNKKPTKGWEY